MPDKTIRNPIPLNNVQDYVVHYSDKTSSTLQAVGATNAWFMSNLIWPDKKITKIEQDDKKCYW